MHMTIVGGTSVHRLITNSTTKCFTQRSLNSAESHRNFDGRHCLVDCMVFNADFNLILVISRRPVHISMPPWSSFNQYSIQYCFQAIGCFPIHLERNTGHQHFLLFPQCFFFLRLISEGR